MQKLYKIVRGFMTPIVVLGMHKSGTTLLSKMLHRSGIAMVDDEGAGGYDDGNHFERTSTKQINKRLLGLAPSSLSTFEPLDLASVAQTLIHEATQLVDELAARQQRWGFKDPRTCLTYPFWKVVLPPHRLICVYRKPEEVHAHYGRRRFPDPTRGIRSLRAWYEYNLAMLTAFRHTKPEDRLLIEYATLMQEKTEIDRLARFVGCPIVDVRDPSLRRGRAQNRSAFLLESTLLKLATRRNVQWLGDQILGEMKTCRQIDDDGRP